MAEVDTEEMIQEEQELQEASAENEALVKHSEKELSREESLARLQRLLETSSTYSQFLLQRIQQQKQENKARPQNKTLQEVNENCQTTPKRRNSDSASPRSAKRARSRLDENKLGSARNVQRDNTGGANTAGENQPSLFTGGILRPYQVEGFNWLKLLHENGVNGILGDEMGLGKTAQVLALLAHLKERRIHGPFLIIAPLSTAPQWVAEAKRFVPSLSTLLYHGPQRRANHSPKQLEKVNLVVTSYEVAMRDASHFANVRWRFLVVDEGHRLKNPSCHLAKTLHLLRTDGRLLLTGTPLQNSLAELWALLHFLLPEIFSDLDAFQSWFDVGALSSGGDGEALIVAQEQKDHVIATMHEILRPFLLRRTKEEVCLQIPQKKEVTVWAPMSPLQEQYYSACINHSIELLLTGKDKHNRPSSTELNIAGRPRRSAAKSICYTEPPELDLDRLEEEVGPTADSQANSEQKEEQKKQEVTAILRFSGEKNLLMDLRKICSHPYLVRCPLEDGLIPRDEALVEASGKLRLLDAMLLQLRKRGHKVLLFSQMTHMLDLLEEYCCLRNFQYCRLDGNTSAEDRVDQIRLFNEDSRKFIFLLSTRAGGLGLNLTAADTVVLFDSDWNPQSDAQASARCHRIGQTRPVIIYRLVVRGTVDQRMVEMATAKRKLECLIMQKGKFSFHNGVSRSAVSPEELQELLKSADTPNVVHADAPVLSLEDLNALLDRSDKAATHSDVFQLVKNEEAI
ncbi:lymphocyte-specific helicase-like [Ornithodoros turicata]|uniref:lymphocyte-specific helicase-like n=1 Tax=Ornithodoros turicata TaxID=34597 RepID=UPI00313A358A